MSRSRRDRINLSQSILSRPPQVASMFSYSVLTNEQSQQLIIILMAFDILNSKFSLNQYKIFIQTSDISNHMFSKDIHDVDVCYHKISFLFSMFATTKFLLPQNFLFIQFTNVGFKLCTIFMSYFIANVVFLYQLLNF